MAEIQKQPLSQKLWPLTIAFLAIVLDQISKALVVAFIPQAVTAKHVEEAIIPLWQTQHHDILRLIHVRNNAIAFSMGSGLSDNVRTVLFALAPLVVILIMFVVYFRNNDFTRLERWSICGILGGGLGNLIDRFFRPEGVVDFIDCVFFGEFNFSHWPKTGVLSWSRWPTFNIADSFVVVCGILLVISFIIHMVQESKAKKQEEAQ